MTFLVFGGVVPVNAAANDITTVAGRPDAGDGGPATSALVHLPHDVAVGPTGDVFIADTWNHRIRKVTTAGTITTVAGNGTSGFSGDGGAATSARLRFPEGIWVDGAGTLFIADTGNHRVRKVDTSGTITTIAGTGTAGYSGDNGPATAARLNAPRDVTTGSSGNIYIADTKNHRVRRIDSAGTITTFAGTGTEGYSGDGGAATSARLNDPSGVGYSSASGAVYIADTDNNHVRRVSTSGTISGYDGGSALDAPRNVTVGGGYLYIADTENYRIRRVTSPTSGTTYAGTGSPGFSGDGGPAGSAALDDPTGVAVDASGNLFIADKDNHRVREVGTSQVITTFAGGDHFGGDGGAGTDAAFDRPYGIALDGAGNVYIADTEGHRIRRLSGGVITTIAGTGVAGFFGNGGDATLARLNYPYDVAVDVSGNVYVADTFNHRIRKIDPAGIITTFAGTGSGGYSGDNGPATSAQLQYPAGLDVDASGNVYIADYLNHRIRRVTPAGTITTVAGNGNGWFCGDGGAATAGCIETPADVAVGSGGSFYIADYGNHRIRSVISGTIRTVAGNGVPSYSGDGGPATSAALNFPGGVDVDPTGAVFIADSRNNRVRKVDTSGIITTVGGTGVYGFSGDGGPAVLAEMAFPARVAFDADGNFFIPDIFNNRIRMVEGLGSLSAPSMTGTDPASPANDNSPLVQGTADSGTTVKVYTNAACSGAVAGSGTDLVFGSTGIAVSVPDDSTTSFYATATDGLGNVSACSSAPVIYIEDSTAPGPPVITIPPASPDSDLTPSWSFTAEAGAGVECELSGGTFLQTQAPCTSPATFDITGQLDGDYTFRAWATDAAGNVGGDAVDTYTLNSTSPAAPTLTSTPTTPDDDLNPSWSFTVELGLTAECELIGGTMPPGFASCTSPKSYSLAGQPDGDYTFRVQARNIIGTPSAPTSHTYTLDTTDPGAPTITSSPPSPGNSTSPNWSFTSDPGTTTECELARGGTPVSPWGPCATPKTYNLSGEPDGDYDFSVRATDAAGNTGPAATSSYTLDTTGPVSSITSSPASPDNDPNPSWDFSTEAGASPECELRRGDTVVSPWTACASPESYDLGLEPDDTYTFSVRATDGAGNTGDPESSNYTFDTTPPEVTITSGPAPVSSDQSPTWDFVSEAGVTFECQLLQDGVVFDPWTGCSGSQTYDLSLEPDALYTFEVRGTDAAGNTGPATTSSYTLDTSGPTVNITASPPTPDNIFNPSWSFITEAGATPECELASGATVIVPFASCTSPFSYDLSGQPDGDYTFTVHAIDAALNVGAPASHTYTLDTTAPAAPAITSAPASPGTATAVSWSFTTEPGATTECELSRGGTVLSPWASCTSPAPYSLGGEPDGDYTFRVRATDFAGNTGSAATDTYTLDRVAPSISFNPPSPSPGNDRTPTWGFTTEPGASTECELSSGASILQPFASCLSPVTYDLAGQPDGPYTVRVRATDAAGNPGIASSTYQLDTAGPNTTIVAGPPSPGNDTTPTWSFTTEPGATTECELTLGGTVIRPYASCSSPKTYDVAADGDGSYTFAVRATDSVGNTGPVATSAYTLDATPPATPVITSGPTSPGSGLSPSWSFTAELGATTECELTSGGTILQAFAPCTSPQDYGLAGRPDGVYTFHVRAVDALSNTSAPAAGSFTLDTTPPTVSVTDSPSSPGSTRNPTWSFSAEAGATTECKLTRGATVLSPSAACSSPVAFALNGEPDGTYTFEVRATDQAGNQGPPDSSTYVLDTTSGGGGGGGNGDGNGGNGDGNGGNGDGNDGSGGGGGSGEEPPNGGSDTGEPSSPEPVADPGSDEPLGGLLNDGGSKQGRAGDDPGTSEGEESEEQIAPTPEEARASGQGSTGGPDGLISEFIEDLSTVAAGLIEEPAFPLVLSTVVFGFLILQNRIDRRDPKLALAPVHPDPHLYFDPQDESEGGR